MEGTALSAAMEDCLKTIFRLSREGGGATPERATKRATSGPGTPGGAAPDVVTSPAVSTGALAAALGVSAPTATQAIKRLAAMDLVDHTPYRGAALTDAGERVALEIIRHHRLIERYLHEVLGVPKERVHGEAERWEHVLSEEVEDLMARALDHPTHDPHGSPIPTAELLFPGPEGPDAR